jgi:hypothetical protein
VRHHEFFGHIPDDLEAAARVGERQAGRETCALRSRRNGADRLLPMNDAQFSALNEHAGYWPQRRLSLCCPTNSAGSEAERQPVTQDMIARMRSVPHSEVLCGAERKNGRAGGRFRPFISRGTYQINWANTVRLHHVRDSLRDRLRYPDRPR